MTDSNSSPWRLGTRGSPLALAQANETRDRLAAAHGLDRNCFDIVPIRTSGDRHRDRPLAEIGGKGLFVRELDAALEAGQIDLAVHSAKDLPGNLAEAIGIAAVLPRADCAEVLVAQNAESLDGLAPGTIVGTCAPRRAAQILHLDRGLRVAPLRGNVQTRLAAARAGKEIGATLLAAAGLARLNISAPDLHRIDPQQLLPAVGQGTLVVTALPDTEAVRFASAICDAESRDVLTAERAFLAMLDGNCHSPIAGLAIVNGDALEIRGELLEPDGSRKVAGVRRGSRKNANALGKELATTLLQEAGAGFWGR